jgi:hypothetical protein
MMSRSRALATIGVLSVAAPAAAIAARTSHVKTFQDPKKTAECGLKIHAPKKPVTLVLCTARGIPRTKSPVGDPFVQLGATGSARLVAISQASWVSNSVKTLSKGTLWSSIGVTCNVGTNTLLCFNRDNHGFVIGNRKYKSF